MTEKAGETFEKCPHFVIPAKAGIQKILKSPDSYFRRNDEFPSFGRFSKVSRRPMPDQGTGSGYGPAAIPGYTASMVEGGFGVML